MLDFKMDFAEPIITLIEPIKIFPHLYYVIYMPIIAKGAEATISLDGKEIVKERVKKSYRLQQLDEALRRRRNRSEAALMREARRAGVVVPQIVEEKDFSIKMEFVDGDKVRDMINEGNCIEISRHIAEAIAKLHSKNIVHGDLTTSNMIIKHIAQTDARSASQQIYFIDFGLGFFSPRVEDKAIDLHLLHEALESTHFNILEKAWYAILEVYKNACSDGGKVIKTLAEIEKRGRYRER